MSGPLTIVQQSVLRTLIQNEIDGTTAIIGDFYAVRDAQHQTADQFNRAIKELEVHGCVELTPKPCSASEITPKTQIVATSVGKGSVSRPHNGNYWLPDAQMVVSQTHVQAQIAQVGNNNSITLNLNALPAIIETIEKSDLKQDEKKSLIKSIWDFVAPIAQGAIGETVKRALGI